jgi:FkbM family methyltransferase
MTIIDKVTRKIKNGPRFLFRNCGPLFAIRSCVSLAAVSPSLRGSLNSVYLKLNPSQRVFFHQEFSQIFKNRSVQGGDGNWEVAFANKVITMPLSSENFWLDWDTAVSIVGHDIEVKQTYEALIESSSKKPDLLIDIGANYGTHSLLFLVHGIKTITFEPNSSCHDFFRKTCELNHVVCELEHIALGDREGFVDLTYPQRETWLGSTDTEVVSKLGLSQELVTEKVEQKMLDDYLPTIGQNQNIVIKIDTEGNELSVLRGAVKTLQECKPIIIFECWGSTERTKIFDFFGPQNYSIHHLPWNPTNKSEPLTSSQFMASSSTNFIAMSN